jgi:hypothetical protein
MRELLRSRKAFIAVSLFAFPPASWAFAIYLHDDLRIIWQNFGVFLAIYFGATAALVVALGSLTSRTRNEMAAVVVATAGMCVVFMAAMIVWGLSHSDLQ